jgi:hypothetical protein
MCPEVDLFGKAAHERGVHQAVEGRIGDGGSEATFRASGTGSADGSDGTVRLGLQGIDTALQLFDSMKVSYESE